MSRANAFVSTLAGILAISLHTPIAHAEDYPRRRNGPGCVEGAKITEENEDCPLPLVRSEHDHPWDNLYTHGLTFRATAFEVVSGKRSGGPPLGGIGVGYRYFLSRRFQVEMSADLVGGIDGEKNPSAEIPIAIEGVMIPIRGDLQIYLRGGVAAFLARTQIDGDHVETHRHLGVIAGAGGQFYVSREVWLLGELVGFSRQRAYSSGAPGAHDAADGPAADHSYGFMARVGMTVAWGGL